MILYYPSGPSVIFIGGDRRIRRGCKDRSRDQREVKMLCRWFNNGGKDHELRNTSSL